MIDTKLKILGVGRDAENDQALIFIFNRPVTDDEMRTIHEGANQIMTEVIELKYLGWVILELMGHRTRVGRATEEQIAGAVMLRVDIPVNGESDEYTTEYYGGSSIYCMSPVTEEIARANLGSRDRRPPRPVDYQPDAQIEDQSQRDSDGDYASHDNLDF